MSEGSAPGRRPRAPGDLGLLQDFVNTHNVDPNEDKFATPDRLRQWLTDRALITPGERVSRGDRDRVLEVREALRALLLANNQEPLDPGAVETLNRAADTARFSVRFDPNGPTQLEPAARGVGGALGRIIFLVLSSMSEGTWTRFKACRDDACREAFYDHSKNRSGTWCDMAVCGNRAKARSYRERQRAERGG
jgi:predicted RNA-binding Zn ribbon-like protein